MMVHWNQLLAWAIFKCSGSCQRVKMWSLEELTGLTLVSGRMTCSTVSESFLRLNELQRLSTLPHEQLPMMQRGERPAFSKYNRLTRTMRMLHQLDWTVSSVNRTRSAGLVFHHAVPSGATLRRVSLASGGSLPMIFNYRGLFSAHGQSGSLQVY